MNTYKELIKQKQKEIEQLLPLAYQEDSKNGERIHGTWSLSGKAALLVNLKVHDHKKQKPDDLKYGKERAIQALLVELYDLKYAIK